MGTSYLAQPVNIGGALFGANRLVTLSFALVIGLIFYFYLARTRMGKAIRAAAQDRGAAALMGININYVLAMCFALGAAMAGIAGMLISMSYPVNGLMGFEYTTIAIIVVVLGGLGSIPGSFIGGFLLGLVGSVVTYFQPGSGVGSLLCHLHPAPACPADGDHGEVGDENPRDDPEVAGEVWSFWSSPWHCWQA